MGIFSADLKYALRMLGQQPGFAATAIMALALGIGANTAIFSVMNAVILRPLPFPDPDRIVVLMNSSPQGNGSAASVTKYNVWKEQGQVLDDIAAYDNGATAINLSGTGQPEQLQGSHVSREFFRLFGAEAALGRTFTAEEDRPHGGNVVVLSYGVWQRRFGADRSVIGKSISLGGEAYTVIGVLTRNFAFSPPPDLYLPFQADPNSTSQVHFFRAAARLRAGVSLGAAKAALNLAGGEFRRRFPGAIDLENSFTVEPMQELMVRNVRPALYILLGAVGCVLLIACANVANLLLARANVRSREIAVRAALGASRYRIVRQLLTESLLLSTIGGCLGFAIGILGMRALISMNSGRIPRVGENGTAVSVDWTVLAFTLMLTLTTSLLFSLAPALHASSADINAMLKEGTSRFGSALRQNGIRNTLVVVEIAIAIVLLTGAGLLVRTFAALQNVAPGFDPHKVLTLETALTGTAYDRTDAISKMSRHAIERIEAIPGVEAAAASSYLPLDSSYGLGFTMEGKALTDGSEQGFAAWSYVTSNFFRVLKIPVVRGRTFTQHDDAASPPVVVINEAMAKQYWKDEESIGRRIRIGSAMGPEFTQRGREIVGVIANTREAGLNSDPQPAMFVPLSQVPDSYMKLNNRFMPLRWLVRTHVDPHSLTPAIRRTFAEVADLPAGHVRTMDSIVVSSTARHEFNTLMLSIFAFIAISLASIGLYAVVAFSVEQRTHELGIRLALGASFPQVRNMIVLQAMRLAMIGIAIGLVVARGFTRLLASMLFQVKENDPLVFVLVALLLGAVAFFASYLPARRALGLDPLVALRCQ